MPFAKVQSGFGRHIRCFEGEAQATYNTRKWKIETDRTALLLHFEMYFPPWLDLSRPLSEPRSLIRPQPET